MATRINIIITIDTLLKTIKPLMVKYGVRAYVRKYNDKKGMHHVPYDEHQSIGTDPEYNNLFFISKEVNGIQSFYDDAVCVFCMECVGGRFNAQEMEIVELRLLSKTPDAKIKSFSTAIRNFIKKDPDFGAGILPLDNLINKNTFYSKSDINNRTIWRDFKRKEFYKPIKIA
jgi:hypothetical protein